MSASRTRIGEREARAAPRQRGVERPERGEAGSADAVIAVSSVGGWPSASIPTSLYVARDTPHDRFEQE